MYMYSTFLHVCMVLNNCCYIGTVLSMLLMKGSLNIIWVGLSV